MAERDRDEGDDGFQDTDCDDDDDDVDMRPLYARKRPRMFAFRGLEAESDSERVGERRRDNDVPPGSEDPSSGSALGGGVGGEVGGAPEYYGDGAGSERSVRRISAAPALAAPSSSPLALSSENIRREINAAAATWEGLSPRHHSPKLEFATALRRLFRWVHPTLRLGEEALLCMEDLAQHLLESFAQALRELPCAGQLNSLTDDVQTMPRELFNVVGKCTASFGRLEGTYLIECKADGKTRTYWETPADMRDAGLGQLLDAFVNRPETERVADLEEWLIKARADVGDENYIPGRINIDDVLNVACTLLCGNLASFACDAISEVRTKGDRICDFPHVLVTYKLSILSGHAVSELAGTAVAAAIEYVSQEILELSGRAFLDNLDAGEFAPFSDLVGPRHIFLALKSNKELSKSFRSVLVLGGGVMPQIQERLLNRNCDGVKRDRQALWITGESVAAAATDCPGLRICEGRTSEYLLLDAKTVLRKTQLGLRFGGYTATRVIEEADAPDLLCCPITRGCMIDPVVASDGHTYERSALEKWLRDHDTSPKTGLPLQDKAVVVPNYNARSHIQEWKQQNDERGEDPPGLDRIENQLPLVTILALGARAGCSQLHLSAVGKLRQCALNFVRRIVKLSVGNSVLRRRGLVDSCAVLHADGKDRFGHFSKKVVLGTGLVGSMASSCAIGLRGDGLMSLEQWEQILAEERRQSEEEESLDSDEVEAPQKCRKANLREDDESDTRTSLNFWAPRKRSALGLIRAIQREGPNGLAKSLHFPFPGFAALVLKETDAACESFGEGKKVKWDLEAFYLVSESLQDHLVHLLKDAVFFSVEKDCFAVSAHDIDRAMVFVQAN